MSTNNNNAPPIDFTPTPGEFTPPPWVSVPGIANFRDIGGYPVANGTGSVSFPLLFPPLNPTHHAYFHTQAPELTLATPRFAKVSSTAAPSPPRSPRPEKKNSAPSA